MQLLSDFASLVLMRLVLTAVLTRWYEAADGAALQFLTCIAATADGADLRALSVCVKIHLILRPSPTTKTSSPAGMYLLAIAAPRTWTVP